MKNRITKGILNLGLRWVPESGGMDKDVLRQKYINISNELIQKKLQKSPPDRVLLLLPRCIQSAECLCKVTLDISECKGCNRCLIGTIRDISSQIGIHAQVVSGGTAARYFVKACKPSIIIAVACERELISGMQDVKGIPVVGIINQRPNGQCFNTTVDLSVLKENITNIVSPQ